MQAVEQCCHSAGAGHVHLIIPLQNLQQPGVHHLGIQTLKGQKQDAESRGIGRLHIFFPDILCLAAQHQFQCVAGVFHCLCIAGGLRILQVGIGIAGEFGVDGQPDTVAVHTGHTDGVLHPLGAAGDGGYVGVVLLRRKDLFQNRTQLDLAQNAAGLNAGEYLLQPAHIGGKALHLAQALVHLFQLVVDRLKAFGHPLLQRVLQLLVHGVANLVQLLGVLCLHGGKAVCQRFAHLLQLAGVGGLQPLQALLHGLLLGVLPCRQGAAHALHCGLQGIADVRHRGQILLCLLRLLFFQHPRLRFQLLAQPLLQGFIVLPGGGLAGAVQQKRLQQTDGHQQKRVQSCQKFHRHSPFNSKIRVLR